MATCTRCGPPISMAMAPMAATPPATTVKWHVSTGRAGDGQNSLYFGQNEVPNGGAQGDYDYRDPITDAQLRSRGVLTGPNIVLPGDGQPAYVTFDYFLETEK